MSLRAGAETVVNQCLNVQEDEYVVVVNDGNDPDLVEALLDVLSEVTPETRLLEYPEPEHHGSEPPADVAQALRESDVFIAPTLKSLSHTDARREACRAGARGATMPGITREIWTTSLLADYDRVASLTRDLYGMLSDADEVHVTTPSGTDLTLSVEEDYCEEDTGIVREPGEFSNLPAGEAFTAPLAAEGTLVIDQFPYAPSGTRVEIEENEVVAVEHPDGEESELAGTLDEVDGARTIAELGIGTNPEATIIGNPLQDEKVLGTIHVAFGSNASMVPEGDPNRVDSDVHLDTVCEEPTVRFDGDLVIDAGDPLFT